MQERSLRSLGRLSDLSPLNSVSSLNSLSEIYLQTIKKKELAEKVLSGKRLKKSERDEIYRFLTGKEPIVLTKRGRPSTVDRDFGLAIDYLYEKAEGKKRTDKLRQELAKKHGLSGRENTFYVALNRGIADWHELATYWIDHYSKGGFSDRTEEENKLNLKRMQRALQLIEEHRKAGGKLQKKVTE